jgi:hypothetical protein
MRDLSNNLLAQLYAQQSDDPFLSLFTLDHDDWDAPLYLVNNTEEVTSNGNVFLPFPLALTLPVDDGESLRKVQLEFDNVSRELVDEIRSVTDTNINVTIQLVLASDPDTVEVELSELSIKNVNYDASRIQATLFLDDFLNTELTSEKYAPTNFPGIFT